MSKVLISTIVPVYNSTKYINRCIDSLLAAQIEGIQNEVILINDGSTDSSLEICEKYATKHKNIKVISQENQGLSGARNTGLENATGKYISFVDSDDSVSKDYFKVLIPYLDGKYDIIHFGYKRIDRDRSHTRIPIEKIYNETEIKDLLINTSKNKALWFVWSRIYKTTFLKNNDIIFDEEIKYGEDSVFLVKVYSKLVFFKAINSTLYNYYENEDSLTGQKYKLDLLNKFEIQYKKRKEVKVSDVDNQLLKSDLANNYINHSLFALLTNFKNTPIGLNKLNEIKKMRDSIVFEECFKNYNYDWKHPKRSAIIKLFELRQYKLLFKTLKIYA